MHAYTQQVHVCKLTGKREYGVLVDRSLSPLPVLSSSVTLHDCMCQLSSTVAGARISGWKMNGSTLVERFCFSSFTETLTDHDIHRSQTAADACFRCMEQAKNYFSACGQYKLQHGRRSIYRNLMQFRESYQKLYQSTCCLW